MSRIYRAGDTYAKSFTISNATGAAANADSTPTGSMVRNGAVDATPTVAITNPATGQYKAAATIPIGYAANDVVELLIAATVGGVATKAVVDAVRLVAFDPSDAAGLGLSRVDAAISTRLATVGYTAPPSAATVSSTVWAETTRALTDKAGFALSSAGVQAIWDALTSALTTAGSVGKLLADNVNATISSRSSHSAADIWAVGTRTLSAFSFAVDLSAGAATAIWDKATSALTVAGSIGKLLVDNLNATVASRLASGSAVTLDTTQVISDVGGATNTLGGILSLIRAALNGRVTIISAVQKMFGQNGTTQIGVDRTFTGTVPDDTTRS